MASEQSPSAFPVNTANLANPGAYEPEPGMDLRDYFAAKAIAGLMLKDPWGNPNHHAAYAYNAADAMIAERSKVGTDSNAPGGLQHVAYFDEGQFHWMGGIAPRDCELYAKPIPKATGGNHV